MSCLLTKPLSHVMTAAFAVASHIRSDTSIRSKCYYYRPSWILLSFRVDVRNGWLLKFLLFLLAQCSALLSPMRIVQQGFKHEDHKKEDQQDHR